VRPSSKLETDPLYTKTELRRAKGGAVNPPYRQ